MKKIVAVILALLYLTVSTGATVHLHYCMGKMTGKGLLYDGSGKCGKCGMGKNKDNGCCKDEPKQLKIENDQNIPESDLPTFQIFYPALSSYTVEMPVIDLPSIKGIFSNNAPPPKSHVAVHIRNCVFLV